VEENQDNLGKGPSSPGKHRGHSPQPRCSWTPGSFLNVRTFPALSSVVQARGWCFSRCDCPVGSDTRVGPQPCDGDSGEAASGAEQAPVRLPSQKACRGEGIAERGVSEASGLAPGIWSLYPCGELCSACCVQGLQSLCCSPPCRQYSLSAERKTMAHPNSLDRRRTKYLMRNVVSCGAWRWWWWEPV